MKFRMGFSPATLALAIALTGTTGLLSSCASDVKKADISSDANPSEELSKLSRDIDAGYTKQLDVLAANDFEKARKSYDKAKDRFNDGDKQKKVVEAIAISRGHLNRATEIAEGRRDMVQGILDSREAAVTAGARNLPRNKGSLGDVDKELENFVDEKTITPKEFDQLQTRYQKLEVTSIQERELGEPRAAVVRAVKNKAEKNTPKILNKTELSIANAENLIAGNRSSASVYRPAVQEAKANAVLLEAILASTKRANGETASEEVATNLVMQGRQMKGLNSQLGQAQGQLAAKDEALNERDREIQDRERTIASERERLAAAHGALSLDQALEEGRKQFNEDEAEVYRQGNKLVVRLKAMKFTTGSSELPAESLALLSKVSTVASSLNPTQVVVQGHTDSTGTPAINKSLSENRAHAVATYLSNNGIEDAKVDSVGYGFEKPLASNKTKEGRAMNRRVDIVITPASPQTGTSTQQ